jgi:hypothetical protein
MSSGAPTGEPGRARDDEGGIQLIELCGGFSPVSAGKSIEAIDDAVPVGVVAYGPESIGGMHRLFPS